MTEKTLRDYFDGKIDSDELSIDLKDSQKRTSYDVTTYYVDKLEEGEFEVTREHLVKICDEVISEKLSVTDLNTIAFAIMASDYFTWDGHSIEGERVANVIFEWDNPEIGYDIKPRKSTSKADALSRDRFCVGQCSTSWIMPTQRQRTTMCIVHGLV